ncbi:MAG TPA: ribonuclease Y [Clostridiaceae bacterium]|nr:ribonuclease Y [Clostridiaceae bacterium]
MVAIVIINWYRRGLSKQSIALQEQRLKTSEDIKALILEARKEGEDKKREFLLEAKEEVHRVKAELEKDARDKRNELSRERNRIEQKEESLDRKVASLEQKEQELEQKQCDLQETEDRLLEIEQRKVEELERISGLSVQEAQRQVLDEARIEYEHDMALMFRQIEEETKENAHVYAKEIVVNAIQRYAADFISEATVSVVALPNEEMKGRIIGREGRNIRTIETLTGVDLIIDDTPETVILSSFDPIRREIARIAIEKLVQDGRIHPARIEEMVEKARKEIDQSIKEAGEEAVFVSGVVGIHPEAVKILGRLKYRTSYGQNVLQHSVEVSGIAGIMASDLDLDVMAAKKAGLLHDIGKAVDFEMEGSHIQLGVDIAKKLKLDEVTTNAIASHHGDEEPSTMIASLVAAADAISAARPGARRENVETYIKRIEKLEEIANSMNGVEKSYAVQAGREIRVIVVPEQVRDDEMPLIAHRIAKQIESELSFPGQIKVNMIRESRVTDYAK